MGLELALQTIRNRKLGAPAVLLVSDLDDDSGDRERLSGTALTFKQLRIPVRVVGLNPAPDDERTMAGLLRTGRPLAARAARRGAWRRRAFRTGLVLGGLVARRSRSRARGDLGRVAGAR